MSKKLLSFLLSELKTVRVLCKKATCGGISEVPLADVERLLSNAKCPFCGESFRVGNEDSLAVLAGAVKSLNAIRNKLEVEFVLEDKS